jgi:hypothetical protein
MFRENNMFWFQNNWKYFKKYYSNIVNCGLTSKISSKKVQWYTWNFTLIITLWTINYFYVLHTYLHGIHDISTLIFIGLRMLWQWWASGQWGKRKRKTIDRKIAHVSSLWAAGEKKMSSCAITRIVPARDK